MSADSENIADIIESVKGEDDEEESYKSVNASLSFQNFCQSMMFVFITVFRGILTSKTISRTRELPLVLETLETVVIVTGPYFDSIQRYFQIYFPDLETNQSILSENTEKTLEKGLVTEKIKDNLQNVTEKLGAIWKICDNFVSEHLEILLERLPFLLYNKSQLKDIIFKVLT